jgi:hypothetical protein
MSQGLKSSLTGSGNVGTAGVAPPHFADLSSVARGAG